eukprot:93139-Pleurochrysis_carterae.AAC.3
MCVGLRLVRARLVVGVVRAFVCAQERGAQLLRDEHAAVVVPASRVDDAVEADRLERGQVVAPVGLVEADERAVVGVLGHVERRQLGGAERVRAEEVELLDRG